MISRLLNAVLLVFILTYVSQAGDEQEVPEAVSARLVSDVSVIEPGKPFKIGVLFEIIPHWHIYWKNSGDTGLPTKVTFNLPQGSHASELKWPLPNVYTREGDIRDYGYEDSLLLYSDVTVPEGFSGTEALISADASWVSCEEICIPGKAALEITLPVSDNLRKSDSGIFIEWKNRMPVPESAKKNPFGIEVRANEMDGARKTINLTLKHGAPVSSIEFYPVPGDKTSVSGVEINESGEENVTDIKFNVRALSGAKQADSSLESLIVYNDADGLRSGLIYYVPIEN